MPGHPVQLRWGDFDRLGHLSHVAVLALLEAGRDVFLREHGVDTDGYVVAHCEVSYLAELTDGQGQVLVHCRSVRLGRSSLTTAERVVDAAGTTIVEAAFTLVMWDPATRRSRPLTERERIALAPSAPDTEEKTP